MNRPMQNREQPTPSLVPSEGWHCSHFFYLFDRTGLESLPESVIDEAAAEVKAVLDPTGSDAPIRLQTSIVSGHKADFGLMLMDPDPLKVEGVHQRLMATPLGSCLIPSYSFVSMSEISEYVPTLEQYGQRLVEEGEEEGSKIYQNKLKAFEQREIMMRKQRLTPDFPEWPATCFYPMNKSRRPGANWFTLPPSERQALMTEHGRTGMRYGGRVTQLITVSVGLDDWEWGVTLWASNPEYLKDIVYKMRFDEASAKYAEFGPFYTSYISSAEEMLAHCRITS
ncbi:MAG: heme-dependent peroxidase [Planctomycetaceae bacterium]|nr:heme-dependent peroxidase [Planctomycetaceae bacterium]|tara:strand:- start:340 stop:1185 length:846 start_codon:yes stop_codon:yes gene_type:complete